MTTTIRGRACAVLRFRDRILLNRFGGDSFWALPGGSVEAGEFSNDALVREVIEEIGVRVTCGRLLWVIENLFAYRGTEYTEFGFYYEATWPAGEPLREGEFGGPEADQFFRWAPMAEIADFDLRPAPVKKLLLDVMRGGTPGAITHIAYSGG
jgi:8-oxo-dGTP pyrophosphatase MutT (NUDIX family)